MVQYSYTVSSTTANRIKWSNQRDYTSLVFSMDAIFDPNSTIGFIQTLPNYVIDFTFGVVTGQVMSTFAFASGKF